MPNTTHPSFIASFDQFQPPTEPAWVLQVAEQIAKKQKQREKTVEINPARPQIGVEAIHIGKIHPTQELPSRAVIDAAVDEITAHGAPKLEVFWDAHGWRARHVVFKGPRAVVEALKELGFTYVECEVKIDPESGLRGDRKDDSLELIHLEGSNDSP